MFDFIGKLVDTGGDIIRRHQEGKITLSEAEAELRKIGIDFQRSILEGQVKQNLADAASGDKFRTRWRPAACWMMLVAVGVIVAVAIGFATVAATGAVEMDPANFEYLFLLLKWVGGALLTAMGIREGGKAVGNV